MRKSKFNLTHLHSTTLDMGYLVPICLLDCLPNDSFRISLSSFIRAQPMLSPLMHEVFLYTQYWFVPYRLLWDNWEAFITGGNNGLETPPFPIVKAPDGGFQTGSLADYFGFPVSQAGIEVSAMPFRAMAEIWNTRYRDEDLQSEIPISYDDGLDEITSVGLLSPAWRKDYFTTARGSTQRGGEISVPVYPSGSTDTYFMQWNKLFCFTQKLDDPSKHWTIEHLKNAFNNWETLLSAVKSAVPIENGVFSKVTLGGNNYKFLGNLSSMSPVRVNGASAGAVVFGAAGEDSGIEVILNEKSNNASGSVDIRDLRVASALQRYQERSLKYGNRYEEFIMREFGIQPRDSRIQRPEYLGGSKSVLQISEVLQTAEGTDTGVGTMRGHGVAGMRQRPIRFTCPEHGLILGLLSIRPAPVYTQGIDRAWLKRTKLDFFVPELANIGMQEVFTQELFATKDNKNTIFGYQDRYNEYRSMRPRVTGEFRTTQLSYWNIARHFEQAPFLNDNFVNMAFSTQTFKRPFAVQNQHAFLAMIRNNIRAYRPIPKVAKNILK